MCHRCQHLPLNFFTARVCTEAVYYIAYVAMVMLSSCYLMLYYLHSSVVMYTYIYSTVSYCLSSHGTYTFLNCTLLAHSVIVCMNFFDVFRNCVC